MKYLLITYLLIPTCLYAATVPTNITIDQVLELSNPNHENEEHYLYCSASGFSPEVDNFEDAYDYSEFPYPSNVEFQYKVYIQPSAFDGINGIDTAEIKIIDWDGNDNEDIYLIVDGYRLHSEESGFVTRNFSSLGDAGRIPTDEGLEEHLNIYLGFIGAHDYSIPHSYIEINRINGSLEMRYSVSPFSESYPYSGSGLPGGTVQAPVSCRLTQITESNNTATPDDQTPSDTPDDQTPSVTPDDQTPSATQDVSNGGGGSFSLSLFLLFILVGTRRIITKILFKSERFKV